MEHLLFEPHIAKAVAACSICASALPLPASNFVKKRSKSGLSYMLKLTRDIKGLQRK